jgi:hypothetical protein
MYTRFDHRLLYAVYPSHNLVFPEFEKIIPRPPGALSKPTAGGYALKDALGWEDATYKYVQVSAYWH